jgi:hypothetical protein
VSARLTAWSGRAGKALRRLWNKPTSISDETAYPAFCARAAAEDEVFARFRRDPVYTFVLEHVSPELGAQYLERALRQTPELAERFDRFRTSDLHGGPVTHPFPPHGELSPTTLRYVKVLSDLTTMFGPLTDMRVAEIGGGYGGQCKIVQDVYRVRDYVIVDLAPCLALAARFLATSGVKTFTPMTAEELPADGSYDLVISNYAFTECTRPVQETYLERILRRSRRGYITGNVIAPGAYRSYGRDELASLLAPARVLPEDPLTYEGNYVLVWDHTRPAAPDRQEAS